MNSMPGSKNPMWKNAKLSGKCGQCSKDFKYYKSVSAGKYCSSKCSYLGESERFKKINIGRKRTEESKKKQSVSSKGLKRTKETKEKIRKANIGRKVLWASGENSHWWKGGVTEKYHGIRKSSTYRRWRKSILERDGGSCAICGGKEKVCVDHLIPFASLCLESDIIKNKKSIFDSDNARTLCNKCHTKTDSYCKSIENQIEGSLILAIKKKWEQLGKPNNDFELFYRMKMEKIIESVKSKLD